MDNNQCPTCHALIPVNAPGGFCPACLLRDVEETPTQGHSAPLIGEIATAFPQLEVLELIGQGGMGFVYKVRQPSLDRIVALKILSPELGRDPAFAERFGREARTLGKLHHPNIVTVFEHGEAGGFFYLIMEYVDGVNLRQAMRAGRFTPQQALAIVPGICDALQYAHEQGVWHRDIKPENILLDRDGKVKIADFGIARMIGDPQRNFTLTMTGNALGSAAYMAPEQHEKPHEVDHRADIYSLGVVIYEMLTGELPLGRFPSPSQRAAVDSRIDEIVFKTLEKERDLRQQSATEVKTDFHDASNVTGTRSKHPTPKSISHEFPTFPWSVGLWIGGIAAMIAGFYTSPLLVGLGLIAATLGLIGCGWILWKIRHGAHLKEHRLPLLLLAFWPVMLGLCICASALWFRGWKEGVAQGDPDPSIAVYGFAAIAISVPLIMGRIFWNLLGKDPEKPKPTRFEIIQVGAAILLILSSSVLVKWVVERENSYKSYRSKFIQLGHDTHWPEDAHLVRQAVVKALGAHATHYRYQILGPGEQKLPMFESEIFTPIVILETTIRSDGRTENSQKHFIAIAERLKASLPKRIEVNSAAGGVAQGASDRAAPSELQRGYRNVRPWNFVFMMAPILVVMLCVASRRPFSWILPFLAFGIAVGVANSPWPKPLDTLPPSIDGLAPLEPLPYDLSTPRAAMESMIKAAKVRDVEACKRGLSSKVLEMPLAETSDFSEPMREFVNLSYGGLISQEGDAASVNMVNQARKETIIMRLVREDGDWKIAQGPHEVKPAVSAPTAPAPPTVSADEVFRKAVAAANESDGGEFSEHIRNLQFIEQRNHVTGRAPNGGSLRKKNLLETMELFIGEIVKLKVAAEANVPSVPEVYATIRRRDGSLSYLIVTFSNAGGQWVGKEARFPFFKAASRIEFKPEKGEATTILQTHLGFARDFRAVEGKPGLYDVIALANNAESAKEIADANVDRLRESLKKFSLDTSLKVISSAVKPEGPYMAEDVPPFEAPKQ